MQKNAKLRKLSLIVVLSLFLVEIFGIMQQR